MKKSNQTIFSKEGFTLIELMVVLVILGLLAGLILPRLMGRTEEARRQAAEVQIKAFEQALDMYFSDNGNYPTTEQGLPALSKAPEIEPVPRKWKGPYLQHGIIPKDPWGNEYVYLSPGVHTKEFDLVSFGKDASQGGEGESADIESWSIGK